VTALVASGSLAATPLVRCVKVVEDGSDLQETDLDVAALLERRSTPRGVQCELVEHWGLTTDQERPYTPFARRVRARVRDTGVPLALFPARLSHLGPAGRVTVATAVDEVTPCLPLAVPWTPYR